MDTGKLTEMMKQLRLRLAVNFFKSCLLGKSHLPGRPQTKQVFDKLQIDNEKILSERTWDNWFEIKPVRPKYKTVKALDKLAAEKLVNDHQDGFKSSWLPEAYFEEMILGGLVSKMLSTTRSKQTRQVLIASAEKYFPVSDLHLHLDAIEVNTIVDGFLDVPWYEVREIAAARINDLLSADWSPRYGKVFSSLSSPLKLRWDAADEEERKQIRKDYARFKPDMFEEKLQAGAEPNWDQIGIANDAVPQHIYKTLFAIAADSEFLIEDRLFSWLFPFATSALSMRALGWCDRYRTFGFEITNELLFWGAFDHILFNHEDEEIEKMYVHPAMNCCQAEWSEESLEIFLVTRKVYQKILADYGISVQDIMLIVQTAQNMHPLVYRG